MTWRACCVTRPTRVLSSMASHDVASMLCHAALHEAAARHAEHPRGPGRAVQVDPIKPMLKAPGAKRLKLKYDIPFSEFAFKFNLRRYNLEDEIEYDPADDEDSEAGAYTRPLFSSI